MTLRSFVTAAVLCGIATTASTQRASAQSVGSAPRQTLATNLLAIPLGLVSLDYEHVVGGAGVTVGVGGLHSFTYDDEQDGPFWWNGRLSWAQAKVKYYPSEQSLRGLALGLTAGAVRESEFFYEYVPYDPSNPPTQPPRRSRRSDTAPTLGVVVDYNFLLGRGERFLIGVGIGAKRVLEDVNDDYDCCVVYDPRQQPRYPSPLQQVYPDGRFTVGFAF
jgi:hypothetical protein